MTEDYLYRDATSALPRVPGGSAITVGTFDGVHRGHWSVLQHLRELAEVAGRRSVLVTFRNHPLGIVRPEAAPRLLTTPDEKKEILAESGIDYVVLLPFTRQLARYSPRRFVEEILIERFQLEHLVMGYDHGFGRGRSGDVDTVRRLGAELGFAVDVVGAVPLDDSAVSSSRIRQALEQGDVANAATALGRPYSISGHVVRGDGRGKGLGFPTANIRIPDPEKLLPRDGIYAVRAVVRGAGSAAAGDSLPGVLHLGPRPTFPGALPAVEVHLFDFDEELYGAVVRVDFCARLRDIMRFDSAQELVEAMHVDSAEAKRVLAAGCAG